MVGKLRSQEKKKDTLKVKSKYWVRTHNYGIRIQKTVQEAIVSDTMNKNTLWRDSIILEMIYLQPAFKKYEGDIENLIGYQHIKYHMILLSSLETKCNKRPVERRRTHDMDTSGFNLIISSQYIFCNSLLNSDFTK